MDHEDQTRQTISSEPKPLSERESLYRTAGSGWTSNLNQKSVLCVKDYLQALLLAVVVSSLFSLEAFAEGAVSSRHRDFLKLFYFHKSEIEARYSFIGEQSDSDSSANFDSQGVFISFLCERRLVCGPWARLPAH